MRSMCDLSSNEFQRIDLKIGQQDSVRSNGCPGDMPYSAFDFLTNFFEIFSEI